MIILGVDPSKANTGLCVFDTDTFELKYQGVIRNPPGTVNTFYDVTPYRRITSGVKATIEAYKPELVLIEKMFISKSGMISEMLFIAAYAARLAAAECGVPYRIVPILGKDLGWYHFMLGATYAKQKNGLGKVNARSTIQNGLGIQFKNEHVGDSASIALAGYFYETGIDFRDVKGLPKPEMDIIAAPKVRKLKPAKKLKKGA